MMLLDWVSRAMIVKSGLSWLAENELLSQILLLLNFPHELLEVLRWQECDQIGGEDQGRRLIRA